MYGKKATAKMMSKPSPAKMKPATKAKVTPMAKKKVSTPAKMTKMPKKGNSSSMMGY